MEDIKELMETLMAKSTELHNKLHDGYLECITRARLESERTTINNIILELYTILENN